MTTTSASAQRPASGHPAAAHHGDLDRILALARAGDVARLQIELAAGRPAGDLAHTYAILALSPHLAQSGARALMDRWLLAGSDTQVRRNLALRVVNASDVLDKLLEGGADPNCARGGPITPLGEALRAGRDGAAHQMLLAIAGRGQAPMVGAQRSLFDWILRSDDLRSAEMADRALVALVSSTCSSPRELPNAFRYAAGAALLSTCTGLNAIEGPAVFLRRARLMTFANLLPNGFSDRWVRVLQHGHARTIADWILDPENYGLAVKIVENLASNGFDLNSHIRFRTLGNGRPMPLLHAAVKRHHSSLVRVLLRRGANPRLPALINEAVVTPITLAKRLEAKECVALFTPFERGRFRREVARLDVRTRDADEPESDPIRLSQPG